MQSGLPSNWRAFLCMEKITLVFVCWNVTTENIIDVDLILFRMFVQVTLRKAIYAKFKKKTRAPLSQNTIQFWEIADIWQWMVLRQNKLVISVQKLHLQSQTQRGRKQHDFKHGFIFVHNLLSKWKSDNKIVSKTCWHTETHGRPYQYTQTRK